jgi:hypothetical protein
MIYYCLICGASFLMREMNVLFLCKEWTCLKVFQYFFFEMLLDGYKNQLVGTG